MYLRPIGRHVYATTWLYLGYGPTVQTLCLYHITWAMCWAMPTQATLHVLMAHCPYVPIPHTLCVLMAHGLCTAMGPTGHISLLATCPVAYGYLIWPYRP